MSLFIDSSAPAELYDKILFWGPPGAGKSHAAMTWPEPVFIDREGGRALHFRDRFAFKYFAATDISLVAKAFKELRSPGSPGETVVVDSASAIYDEFVELHTTETQRGAWTTDWVTVNRRFLACLNFAFGIAHKNVIFTAHETQRLNREGRDFTKAGLKFVGDERLRFAFDYIFRIEPKGDPRVSPPVFHVEKSASPNLKIGTSVPGLDYGKFVSLTRGESAPNGTPPTDEERERQASIVAVLAAAKRKGFSATQLGDLVHAVTKTTRDHKVMSLDQATVVLEKIG